MNNLASVSRSGKLKENYVVEKARSLMLMQDVPFTLGELKVLDTYLSRINARDPAHRTVKFTKDEYERLIGIDRMRSERIEKYVDSMMRKIVTVKDDSASNGWRKFVLFEESKCYRDDHEQWWIEMTCSDSARDLFFALETVGYFRYYLSNIINLTSLYSYQLYLYMLLNRFRGSWSEDVDSLKDALGCYAERYKQFKFFNSEVLKKACSEVNEKTDLKFEYSTVKIGRSVSKIKFDLILDDELDEPILDEIPESEKRIMDPNDPLALAMSVLPSELTREQVDVLRNLALDHVPYEVMSYAEKEMWMCEYMSQKAKLMYASSTPVMDKFGWLKRAVAEDWQ